MKKIIRRKMIWTVTRLAIIPSFFYHCLNFDNLLPNVLSIRSSSLLSSLSFTVSTRVGSIMLLFAKQTTNIMQRFTSVGIGNVTPIRGFNRQLIRHMQKIWTSSTCSNITLLPAIITQCFIHTNGRVFTHKNYKYLIRGNITFNNERNRSYYGKQYI